LSTRTSTFYIWRVGEGGRADIPGECLIDVGFGGGGRGGGVKVGVMKNFAETGDATISAVSTPMSNVRGAER